jgi:hypothetical protein
MAESTAQFAKDFTPTFPASKLGDFCGNQSEATRVKFLRQHKPFADVVTATEFIVKSSSGDNSTSGKFRKKPSNSLLDQNEKLILKKALDESINKETLTFDDEQVIEIFNTSINKSNAEADEDNLDLALRQLKLSEENSSQETNECDYETADSDEESFKNESKLHVEGGEPPTSPQKELQVLRYVSFMRGRMLEDHVLAKVNTESEIPFEKNKAKTITDFGMFKIVGIIDGMSADKKKILEIKTRKELSHVKATITSKERKQAMAYMKMHQCGSCLFIETGPDGALKKTEIEWDEAEFNDEVMSKLNALCSYARGLSEEEFRKLLEKHQIS